MRPRRTVRRNKRPGRHAGELGPIRIGRICGRVKPGDGDASRPDEVGIRWDASLLMFRPSRLSGASGPGEARANRIAARALRIRAPTRGRAEADEGTIADQGPARLGKVPAWPRGLALVSAGAMRHRPDGPSARLDRARSEGSRWGRWRPKVAAGAAADHGGAWGRALSGRSRKPGHPMSARRAVSRGRGAAVGTLAPKVQAAGSGEGGQGRADGGRDQTNHGFLLGRLWRTKAGEV